MNKTQVLALHRKLHRGAVRVAKKVGPVDFNDGSGSKCDPFEPLKHLTSEHVTRKLAR